MAKRKASKKKASKKSTKRKSPAKKKLSWQEETQEVLEKAVKSTKSSKAGIIILSRSGDLLFSAGSAKKIDKTSVGALVTGFKGIYTELNRLLTTKGKEAFCGEPKSGFWVEDHDKYFMLGIKIPRSAKLKSVHKLLRRAKLDLRAESTYEALEGVTEAAVDSALAGEGQIVEENVIH